MAEIVVRDDGVVTAYGSGLAAPPGSRVEEVSDETVWEILDLYRLHPLTAGVTWDGSAVAVLPDDPGKVSEAQAEAARDALRAAIRTDAGSVDPALVSAAIARLDAIIATGSVDPLPASPTNADVVAQVRTLTTAVNVAADAIRDEARILRALIRILA